VSQDVDQQKPQTIRSSGVKFGTASVGSLYPYWNLP